MIDLFLFPLLLGRDLLHNGVCLSYVSIGTYRLIDAWDALVMSSKRLKVGR